MRCGLFLPVSVADSRRWRGEGDWDYARYQTLAVRAERAAAMCGLSQRHWFQLQAAGKIRPRSSADGRLCGAWMIFGDGWNGDARISIDSSSFYVLRRAGNDVDACHYPRRGLQYPEAG